MINRRVAAATYATLYGSSVTEIPICDRVDDFKRSRIRRWMSRAAMKERFKHDWVVSTMMIASPVRTRYLSDGTPIIEHYVIIDHKPRYQ